jgi:hypothetical protein
MTRVSVTSHFRNIGRAVVNVLRRCHLDALLATRSWRLIR